MRQFSTREPGSRALRTMVTLSPRERQVLRLTALGQPDKLIAHRLGISVSTVKTHQTRLRSALGFSSRSELTRWSMLNPEAFAGHAVDTSLHPPGCPCQREWCQIMSRLDLANTDPDPGNKP